MGKRWVALFFVFCLFSALVVLHLGFVSTSDVYKSTALSGSKAIRLEDKRAPIYDKNGEKLTDTKEKLYAAVRPSAAALNKMSRVLSTEDFFELHKDLKKARPKLVKIDDASVASPDIKVIKMSERYSDDGLCAHLIGYVNSDGDGVTGLEKSFDSLFKNNLKKTKIIFPCDAMGNHIEGVPIEEQTEPFYDKAGVYTTIDKNIQRIAENSMDEGKIEEGAVIITEAQSGRIRALASRPNFNPNEVYKSLSDERSPLLNRALCSFTVGSVFKPAIAACALEQGLNPNKAFVCTGSIKINSVEFGCYNHTAHGEVNMETALQKSCNCYFINLIKDMDVEETLSTLLSLGFGRDISLCEGIKTRGETLPKKESLSQRGQLSNLSFGQGELLASPIAVNSYMNTIASGGVYLRPYIIEKAIDKDKTIFEHQSERPRRVIKRENAEILKRYLESAVEIGNAGGAKLLQSSSAGKTATAQTGTFKDGQENYNTWFSGFFPADNPRYVITVFKEHGALGASDCAPVFKKIAQGIIEYESTF